MIETPLAIVRGQPVAALPQDLYIPPEALRIFLEAFEGPLDLLLYLIKKQHFDILDIPIAEVTRQYMGYIELMKELRLELAAEYLVMAAFLAEIKSRLLLPRAPTVEAEETDPRTELIRRLQEYERIKQAALELDKLPQQGRDVFLASAQIPSFEAEKPLPAVQLKELIFAFQDVMRRASLMVRHQIQREPLSIRERMSQILTVITQKPQNFTDFFSVQEGRLGVVVTFIAILELLRQSLIELVQHEPFGTIQVKAKGEQT
jgi:segregation and condensation protein A